MMALLAVSWRFVTAKNHCKFWQIFPNFSYPSTIRYIDLPVGHWISFTILSNFLLDSKQLLPHILTP
jgi:hypothetical protein